MIIIGIDPGTKTGMAGWDTVGMKFVEIHTLPIHRAMSVVMTYACSYDVPVGRIYVEDARLRRWFGSSGPELWKGAGSIMRDCTIWEEFLQYHKIPHVMVPPRAGKTKMTAESFAKLTGWHARTSEHARDAAMLVFGKEAKS